MYDMEKLYKENEDGISILFYLQKIYPGWSLFLHEILLRSLFFHLIQLRVQECP